MLSMKRLGLFLLLCWLPLLAHAQWFSSSQNDQFLPVMEAFQANAWHDGETLYIGVDSAEGYYLYRHQFAVESQTLSVSLGEPVLPEGTFITDEFLGDVYTFRDRLVFGTPLDDAYSGPIDVELTFQGCADAGLCYPPERVTLQAAESEPPAQYAAWLDENAEPNIDKVPDNSSIAHSSLNTPQSADSRFSSLLSETSLPLALGLFFIAGLGLTFTPCVLPMLPILSSIIVGQNPTRPRAFVLSASYVLGMAITYALVGVLMGLFGAGLNLQARLQSAPVLITFALLFTLFALAMFGAFELRFSPRLTNRIDAWQARAQKSGPGGLALAGALSVLVVSPCVTAPLAGALVFISSTGDALIGGAVLFALGLGMGLPLLLVGTLGVTLLPRTGAWMSGVKTAFGLLLLGVAIWMVERLVAGPVGLLLWAGLAIGSALSLGALNFNYPLGWSRARQTLGLMLLAWGIALVLGAAQGNNTPLRPLSFSGNVQQASNAVSEFVSVDSLNELSVALDQAKSANQPAFVHITADWCISCKIMERDVYPDPRVAAALEGFTLISVDVTDTTEESRALLGQFQLFGPPSLLFFDQGQEIREARIQGEATANELAEHLTSLKQWLSS
ncbi:protein-disulfide reductase DsbD [Vreelandella populi]|uniref:Protein-disulfide reductase DsbD n=1 Tax=Vreelandella populi TaxID=2498858 RepID=A0A3S0WMM5_9GAMM|nr:protein-disulfide reductase DsbD [Halomonas populi]RUR36596.1 protein-disulfide reductase DsbD [Halomonas populi]RUR45058.1 protein-disulfide reductase DsbD [Halomonas populi]